MLTAPFMNRYSEIIGRSVSFGNVEMPSMASFSSSVMSAVSTPSLSSTRTLPMPSLAVEEISWIPSMDSMASSMRRMTAFSTSSGAAPR